MNIVQKIGALFILFSLTCFSAFAESKTFKVKGMHCDGCAETVRKALCGNPVYKRCEVKIKDAKKEIGEVTLETKEGKVDMKAVKEILEKEGYKL